MGGMLNFYQDYGQESSQVLRERHSERALKSREGGGVSLGCNKEWEMNVCVCGLPGCACVRVLSG